MSEAWRTERRSPKTGEWVRGGSPTERMVKGLMSGTSSDLPDADAEALYRSITGTGWKALRQGADNDGRVATVGSVPQGARRFGPNARTLQALREKGLVDDDGMLTGLARQLLAWAEATKPAERGVFLKR